MTVLYPPPKDICVHICNTHDFARIFRPRKVTENRVVIMPEDDAAVGLMLIELLQEQNGIVEILRGQRKIPPRRQLLHIETEHRV